MEQFKMNLIINIIIGIIFVIGFTVFMLKKTNWFKPGGIAYEYLKSRKKSSNNQKNISKK